MESRVGTGFKSAKEEKKNTAWGEGNSLEFPG